MTELIVATSNQGKLKEFKAYFSDFNLKLTSLTDYPNHPVLIEDGKTFAQNALKKAATIALYTKKWTIADDSGLQVKVLDNAPGIYSARYAGEDADDKKNNAKLMRVLKNVPLKNRQARYRCAIALVSPQGKIWITYGTCPGLMITRARGQNGFGYDPYFLIPKYDKTFGELDASIKYKISHRAKALKKMSKVLEKIFK